MSAVYSHTRKLGDKTLNLHHAGLGIAVSMIVTNTGFSVELRDTDSGKVVASRPFKDSNKATDYAWELYNKSTKQEPK